MDITPVAYFRSPLKEKFGIPRQSGLAPSLSGSIVLQPPFRQMDALRGLDGFDYLWLIWGFSANRRGDSKEAFSATVRPPRLGGNRSVGVFASRSPYRPNQLGLSAVRIESIDYDNCEVTVSGADLMDGTPIYDIKPYIAYSDAKEGVRSGFVDLMPWKPLEVEFPKPLQTSLAEATRDASAPEAVRELISQDPRPQYQDDPDRVYGMTFGQADVRFKVEGCKATVIEIKKNKPYMRNVIILSAIAMLLAGCKNATHATEESAQPDSLRYTVSVTRQMDTSMPLPSFNPYKLSDEPVFDMVTTKGTIRFKLYKETPLHRENFARLAAGHFFDGIIFHRVINGFVIQGGDPFTKDPCRSVEEYGIGDLGYWIPAEIVPGKRHIRGALGAAREGDDINPERMSSSTQFYFVQSEEACKHLDGGYTVFGEAIDGLDVIDSIAAMPTGAAKAELPDEPVTILSVNLVQ